MEKLSFAVVFSVVVFKLGSCVLVFHLLFPAFTLRGIPGKITDPTVPTRVLCMVEGVMHKMPPAVFKQLTEVILSLLGMANGQLKCSACQCLYRTLQRQPSDVVLSVEVNSQLIMALRELAPSPTDIAVTAYWLQVLKFC